MKKQKERKGWTPMRNNYRLVTQERGEKVYKIFFERWTTPYAISNSFGQKKSGDIDTLTERFEELGFLESDRRKPDTYVIRRRQGKWVESSRENKCYHATLNPFFEYIKAKYNKEFSVVIKRYLALLFELSEVREAIIKKIESSVLNILEAIERFIEEHFLYIFIKDYHHEFGFFGTEFGYMQERGLSKKVELFVYEGKGTKGEIIDDLNEVWNKIFGNNATDKFVKWWKPCALDYFNIIASKSQTEDEFFGKNLQSYNYNDYRIDCFCLLLIRLDSRWTMIKFISEWKNRLIREAITKPFQSKLSVLKEQLVYAISSENRTLHTMFWSKRNYPRKDFLNDFYSIPKVLESIINKRKIKDKQFTHLKRLIIHKRIMKHIDNIRTLTMYIGRLTRNLKLIKDFNENKDRWIRSLRKEGENRFRSFNYKEFLKAYPKKKGNKDMSQKTYEENIPKTIEPIKEKEVF